MDNILVKTFDSFNIEVYGSYEKPLFKAKDIADLLDIQNIRNTVKNFNDTQRVEVNTIDAMGRTQTTIFLTAKGVYKVLMRSRKPIAENFQDWVTDLIEEIRLKGKYDLDEKMKELQLKEQELKIKEQIFEPVFVKPHTTGTLYIFKDKYNNLKIGKTKRNPQVRGKQLKTGSAEGIKEVFSIKTHNPHIVELLIHKALDRYRIDNDDAGTEWFNCSLEYAINISTTVVTSVDTIIGFRQTSTPTDIISIFFKYLTTNLIKEKRFYKNITPIISQVSQEVIQEKTIQVKKYTHKHYKHLTQSQKDDISTEILSQIEDDVYNIKNSIQDFIQNFDPNTATPLDKDLFELFN